MSSANDTRKIGKVTSVRRLRTDLFAVLVYVMVAGTIVAQFALIAWLSSG